MEELKRMLKAIHEENKDILTILLYDYVNEKRLMKTMMKSVIKLEKCMMDYFMERKEI